MSCIQQERSCGFHILGYGTVKNQQKYMQYTTPSVRDDGSSVWGRLNNTVISTFVLGLLNSTIHIPWRRKERRGELVTQLSTTPSVRDDGSSVWGRLNNTVISTFVLGLLNIRNNNGVGGRREQASLFFCNTPCPVFLIGYQCLRCVVVKAFDNFIWVIQ